MNISSGNHTIITPQGYEVTYTQITPDMAADMLDANTNNRKVKLGNLNKIGEDMVAGRWVFNGDAIRIDDSGTILDGQHRLMQVEATGVTIDALIVSNLPSSVRATIDTNAIRSAGDELQMRGHLNANGLAAVAAALIRRETFGLRAALDPQSISTTHRVPISTGRIIALIDSDPTVKQLATSSSTHQYKAITRTMGSILYHEFSQLQGGITDADYFFARLRDGAQLPADSPILKLRVTLDGLYNNRRHRISPSHTAALTIKSWNAYRLGHSLRGLSYRQGGASPERFPEPI